jgi:hypothetical protein
MPKLTEGKLTFAVTQRWKAWQPETWSYYRNQFQKVCGGAKVVDLIFVDPHNCAWFIEVKDYRQHCRTKAIDLADEVACKVRDSLAALFPMARNANDDMEKKYAAQVLESSSIRVVLHLEQPKHPSTLFPSVIDPAKVMQKLKQLLNAIDPHPMVVELQNLRGVGWQVNKHTP